MRYYLKVHSKANISQLNLLHILYHFENFISPSKCLNFVWSNFLIFPLPPEIQHNKLQNVHVCEHVCYITFKLSGQIIYSFVLS